MAEERTANEASGRRAGELRVRRADGLRERRLQSGVRRSSGGSRCPAAASASNVARRRGRAGDRAILASRSFVARKSRKAAAVVAKPPGTRIPAPASWLIISPSEAFLPPTSLDVGHAQAVERTEPGVGLGSSLSGGDAPRNRRRGEEAILAYRCTSPARTAAQHRKQNGRPGAAVASMARVLSGSRRRVRRCSVEMSSSYAPLWLSGDKAHAAVLAVAVAALHRAPQRPVQVGVGFLEIADDLEVDALDLRQIQLFDMNKPQQLLDRDEAYPARFRSGSHRFASRRSASRTAPGSCRAAAGFRGD